jgi:dihydrolipoamide dehydrogenase
MLAHKATHQGQVAAEAASGHAAAFEPATVPVVVFTDPEIAWAGLTETEAKETGRDIKVGRFPWVASGRAATLGGGEGMTKLIADPGTEEVLGIGVVGRGAGDLISEGALAVEMGAVARDLSMTVHPHPTLSETVMEAADVLLGRAISIHRPARGEKKK